MATERCRVGVIYSGVPQYYVRETEQKRDGRWVAIPLFDPDVKKATAMSEAVATAFVKKLQGLGVKGLWLEDCRDGRRIEVVSESQPQVVQDNRTAVRVTLDDDDAIALNHARWYVVSPINRPDGAGQWFIRCTPPGFANQQIIYGPNPVACLQRAADIDLLRFAELAPQEQPQQAPVENSNGAPRRRPGDLYGS
jgi:hypothetical protein